MLLSDDILGDIPMLAIVPFISCYKAMDKLVNHCFGMDKVHRDIPELVDNLITHYLALEELSVTLKTHVLFEYLISCLLNLGGNGMGLYSEQAVERIHREFLQNFWQKCKISSVDHPKYPESLFSAVVEFSSKHA